MSPPFSRWCAPSSTATARRRPASTAGSHRRRTPPPRSARWRARSCAAAGSTARRRACSSAAGSSRAARRRCPRRWRARWPTTRRRGEARAYTPHTLLWVGAHTSGHAGRARSAAHAFGSRPMPDQTAAFARAERRRGQSDGEAQRAARRHPKRRVRRRAGTATVSLACLTIS